MQKKLRTEVEPSERAETRSGMKEDSSHDIGGQLTGVEGSLESTSMINTSFLSPSEAAVMLSDF
jgi:hypothetical protein